MQSSSISKQNPFIPSTQSSKVLFLNYFYASTLTFYIYSYSFKGLSSLLSSSKSLFSIIIENFPSVEPPNQLKSFDITNPSFKFLNKKFLKIFKEQQVRSIFHFILLHFLNLYNFVHINDIQCVFFL